MGDARTEACPKKQREPVKLGKDKDGVKSGRMAWKAQMESIIQAHRDTMESGDKHIMMRWI